MEDLHEDICKAQKENMDTLKGVDQFFILEIKQ
jgi:hypothetical protein